MCESASVQISVALNLLDAEKLSNPHMGATDAAVIKLHLCMMVDVCPDMQEVVGKCSNGRSPLIPTSQVVVKWNLHRRLVWCDWSCTLKIRKL